MLTGDENMTAIFRVHVREWWKRETVRFAVICSSCFLIFGALYFWAKTGDILKPFLAFNAVLASSMLNLFGASTEVSGALIATDDSSFLVIAECTSIIPTGVFVATMLAWPSRPLLKIAGICFGSVVFFVINMGRIISLYYIADVSPDLLDLFHFYVWGVLTVVAIAVVWLSWVKLVGLRLPE